MTILDILSILFVVVFYWLFIAIPKPLYHKGIKRSEIIDFLKSMRFYDNGTILIIKDTLTGKYIQLVNHVEVKGKKWLSFDFPDAVWSSSHFMNLMKTFDSLDMNYNIVPTGDRKHVDIRRFLYIYNINDLSSAEKIVSIALDEIGEGQDNRYEVHFKGIVDHDESKRHLSKIASKKRNK